MISAIAELFVHWTQIAVNTGISTSLTHLVLGHLDLGQLILFNGLIKSSAAVSMFSVSFLHFVSEVLTDYSWASSTLQQKKHRITYQVTDYQNTVACRYQLGGLRECCKPPPQQVWLEPVHWMHFGAVFMRFCIIFNKFFLNVCLFLDWEAWHLVQGKMAQFCPTPQGSPPARAIKWDTPLSLGKI